MPFAPSVLQSNRFVHTADFQCDLETQMCVHCFYFFAPKSSVGQTELLIPKQHAHLM